MTDLPNDKVNRAAAGELRIQKSGWTAAPVERLIMRPEFAQELADLYDRLESEGAPDEAYPRMFYMGHRLKHTVQLPEKSFIGKSGEALSYTPEECVWECKECQHEFRGRDGTKCPACGAVASA